MIFLYKKQLSGVFLIMAIGLLMIPNGVETGRLIYQGTFY